MKIPQTPPDFDCLLDQISKNGRLPSIIGFTQDLPEQMKYLHWDELRRRPVDPAFTHEEIWVALKLKRKSSYRKIPLADGKQRPFNYYITESVQRLLHEIDTGSGGVTGLPDAAVNGHERDRYVINSLIDEAITSSQLEGAVSTRDVARDMLKTGRKPRDRSERMILNNFMTMKEMITLKNEKLTPQLVFDIHSLVTREALDKPDAAGRFRTEQEKVSVVDGEGTVYHVPPSAEELPDRLRRMCDFANGKVPEHFVHPVIRAILLHFWLAFDHPFYDGNGRTARALFYWSMLKSGYWLFEYISISSILVKSPAQYARAFLYTETDGNDLNYFIINQAEVINQAVTRLQEYINRKQQEIHEAELNLRYLKRLNYRQQTLVLHAMRHPHQEYTIASHQRSYNAAYATARSDLLELEKLGVLKSYKRGKAICFEPGSGLGDKLKKLALS